MAQFLFSILLIFVTVQANHAISPIEVYWHIVLPTVKMPQFIHDLIYPVKIITRLKVECVYFYDYIWYNPNPNPAYIRSNFFLKKGIHPGAEIKEDINLNKTIRGNGFVPRAEADAILLSSQNFPNILGKFSMVPSSNITIQMRKIINACERPAMKGEDKFRATSLESMLDNVISLLGTHNLQAISTVINDPHEKSAFNIKPPITKFPDQDRLVICHPVPWPHAMYYCHSSFAYKGYTMQLVGKDGLTINAATVCHNDMVNFKQNILDLLNVKPGTDPICHILPEDHLLWVCNS